MRVRVSDLLPAGPDVAVPVVFRNPSYHKTDLTLTYRAPDDRFFVQELGRQNLENVITLQGRRRNIAVPPILPIRAPMASMQG